MRKSVEAWRYVLEMCDAAALRPEGAGEESEEMEADRPRACERLSAAVYAVRFEGIVVCWEGWWRCWGLIDKLRAGLCERVVVVCPRVAGSARSIRSATPMAVFCKRFSATLSPSCRQKRETMPSRWQTR